MKTSVLIAGTLVGAFVALSAPRVPIVQVRDLPNAPSIDIVGWEPGEAQFGLRTRLRRDGTLLGAGRGDHRLFLSTVFVDAKGGLNIANAHTGKVFRKMAEEKDVDACRFGNVCSPGETIGLAVDDAQRERMLRRMIGEDVGFTTRLEPQLGEVRVDGGQPAGQHTHAHVEADHVGRDHVALGIHRHVRACKAREKR